MYPRHQHVLLHRPFDSQSIVSKYIRYASIRQLIPTTILKDKACGAASLALFCKVLGVRIVAYNLSEVLQTLDGLTLPTKHCEGM
jgi:hypothetical protein